MHMEDDCTDRDGPNGPSSMVDARLAQLAAENRRLRQALRDARVDALETAALACAAAEVPSESGGIWYLGLTDSNTRQACTEAVQRLLHAEYRALLAEPAKSPADVIGLG